MAFHEVRYPIGVLYESAGGPEHSTGVAEGAGGGSERTSHWPNAKRSYVARIKKTWDAMAQATDFYIARKGPAIGFRWKDDMDFTTAVNHRDPPSMTDAVIGVATGASGQFQLKTQYSDGLGGFVSRTLQKPVSGTALVSKTTGAGAPVQVTSNITIDYTTGLVTINAGLTAGDVIKGGSEFDVPAQFNPEMDKNFKPVISNYNVSEIPDMLIDEMVGDVTSPDRFYYGGGSLVTATARFNITFAMGKVVLYTGGTTTALMPDSTDLELGGFYFAVTNGGAGTLTIRTFDSVSVIVTLTTGKSAFFAIFNDGTGNKWLGLSN